MLLHWLRHQVGHSRLQRLRGDRWQPVQPAYLTHCHTHKQAGPAAKRLLQRLPVSIAAAAGARPRAVNAGGVSGEVKKPAYLCLHQGCAKRASHGEPGEKAQFCAEHAPGGTEDVKHKKCEHEGCKKMPSCGVPGGRRQFCSEHKQEGMVDLAGTQCAHEGCKKVASYGVPGGRRQFCPTHKPEGTVYLVSAQCEHDGCTKQPSYGVPGGRRQSALRISRRGRCTSGASMRDAGGGVH